MSVTRKNHYVPHSHQEGFFRAGNDTFALLDLNPEKHPKPDGTWVAGRSLFKCHTARAFVQEDLYSTFFGTQVNDEIERKLFGDIDTRGAPAVRAFCETDEAEWHDHFEDLFEYLDIQKLRTPKGLDWLRQQYPELSQNELMLEMQGIRMLNVTTWTTGVREIVSAKNSNTKFILSDHPIAVYNHAVPPPTGRQQLVDPSIALKASQTLFPLNQDHCLILTNLEYAKDPAADPKQRRTFARSYRPTMVSTIEFIKTREFTDEQVAEVNYVLKAGARRYICRRQKGMAVSRTKRNQVMVGDS